MNRLMVLYHRLDREALDCLEMTCKYPGQYLLISEAQVGRLVEMELIEFCQARGWQPNWWGWAVLNWHRQLREARDRKILPAKPREGENGAHLGPACGEFRELLYSGIYCWCGRLRSDHLDEAPAIALRFLACYQRSRKLPPPQERISGRSFRDIVGALPSDLCDMLELIHPQGATILQLYHILDGRIRFLAVQESLNFLLERDLVYFLDRDLRWYPSWDGLGVRNWLRERLLRKLLEKPMSEVEPGENGESLRPSACKRYRPLLSKEGKSCWCGHSRQSHRFLI